MSDTPQQIRDFSLILDVSKEPAVKGERRELWEALKSLNPLQRLELLSECCKFAKRGFPYVEPTSMGELQECYNDLSLLATLHGASWKDITDLAVQWAVKGKKC